MSATRYAFLDKNNLVVSVGIYDSTNPPAAGIASATANIGDLYINGAFTQPTPPMPTLTQAQATQSAMLAAACQSAIEAAFTSSALSASHNYGCKATDQSNVALAAIAGGNLWCWDGVTKDANGNPQWTFTVHNAAQALQVQKDMAAHIQAQQSHYAQQLAAVAAATTVSAVQAVVW